MCVWVEWCSWTFWLYCDMSVTTMIEESPWKIVLILPECIWACFRWNKRVSVNVLNGKCMPIYTTFPNDMIRSHSWPIDLRTPREIVSRWFKVNFGLLVRGVNPELIMYICISSKLYWHTLWAELPFFSEDSYGWPYRVAHARGSGQRRNLVSTPSWGCLRFICEIWFASESWGNHLELDDTSNSRQSSWPTKHYMDTWHPNL